MHSSKKLLSFSIRFKNSLTLFSCTNISFALLTLSSIFSFFESDRLKLISSSSSPIFGEISSILPISNEANSFNSSIFFSLFSISSNLFFKLLYSKNNSLNAITSFTCRGVFFPISASRRVINLSFSNSSLSLTAREFKKLFEISAILFLETLCVLMKYLVDFSFVYLKTLISSLSKPNFSKSILSVTTASTLLAFASLCPKRDNIACIKTDFPAPLGPVKAISPSPKLTSTSLNES